MIAVHVVCIAVRAAMAVPTNCSTKGADMSVTELPAAERFATEHMSHLSHSSYHPAEPVLQYVGIRLRLRVH